jgi:hypothetical protein
VRGTKGPQAAAYLLARRLIVHGSGLLLRLSFTTCCCPLLARCRGGVGLRHRGGVTEAPPELRNVGGCQSGGDRHTGWRAQLASTPSQLSDGCRPHGQAGPWAASQNRAEQLRFPPTHAPQRTPVAAPLMMRRARHLPATAPQ